MNRALDVITREMPAEFEKYADPDLGKPTFSVNLIRGGSKVNIVPDHCEIELDHRALPQEPPGEAEKVLRAKLPGFEVTLISSRPGLHTRADNQHVRLLSRALNGSGHGGEHLTAAPWFADSGVFAQAGVPSVAFGPGSIAQAHTRDEYIEIDQLVAGQHAIKKFLLGLP